MKKIDKIKLTKTFAVYLIITLVVVFKVGCGNNGGITGSNLETEATSTSEPTPTQPAITVVIGDIISFGDYDWRVLDVEGDYALIITENIISYQWYHRGTFENPTWETRWETSEMREYLNTTFFNTFSTADRTRIRETTVINNWNPWFYIYGGNDTTDRIFLLSIEEVVQYFGDSGQLANRPKGALWITDEYSEARIARDAAGSASWWWLRSPGNHRSTAARVSNRGYLFMIGYSVYSSWGIGNGVRPALWLNLIP